MNTKKNTRTSWIGRLLSGYLASCGLLVAQSGTSAFHGVIAYEPGGVIPNANVQLESPATGLSWTATSNADGSFHFPSLQPGGYTLTVDAAGFALRVIRDLVLSASENLEMRILLDLPVFTFQTETAASAAGVRIQSADSHIARVLTLKELATLPQISRDPLQLAIYSPGVQWNRGASRVNGTRNSSTNATMDGILVSDPVLPRLGLSGVSTNLDAISEVRLMLNGGKAEFGRNGGAQVELVSRRGSNRWSGNLFEYHRNTALNANDFFNNMAGVRRPKLILNQYGASLGGPVKRNRTFFFLNFQSSNLAQEVLRNRTVLTPEARAGQFRWRSPGASAIQSFDIPRNDPRSKGIDPAIAVKIKLLPDGNNSLLGDGLNTAGFQFNNPANVTIPQGTARIDHQLRQNHRLFFRFSRSRFDSVDAANNRDAAFPGLESGHQISNNTGFAAGSDWSITAALINELRVGRTGYAVTFHSPRPAGVLAVPTSFTNTEVFANTNRRTIPAWDLSDTASWTRGRHGFKTGVRLQRTVQQLRNEAGIYPSLFTSRNFGNVPAASTGPNGAGIAAADRVRFENLYNDLLGRVSDITRTLYSDLQSYFPAGTPRVRHQLFRDWSGFAQDDWRIHPRFVLNAGLRYELFRSPRETNGVMGTLDRRDGLLGFSPVTDFEVVRASAYLPGDRNNFAPRIGFAYDPSGSGKTAIRGAAGIFYERGIGGYMQNIDANTPGFALSAQSLPNAGNSDIRISDGPALPLVPNAVQLRPAPTRSTSLMTPASGLRTPYFAHWNFTVQREFLHGTVVEAGYVATRGVKLILDPDVNQKNLAGSGFLADFLQLRAFQANASSVPATNALVRVFGSPAAAINALGASNFQLGAAGAAAESLDRVSYPRYAAAGLPQSYLRLFPQFSTILAANSSGRSYFDSLQLSLRRDSGWLRASANYTFSKNIDLVAGDGGGNTGDDVPIDRFNYRLSRGLSDFHVPHSLNVTATTQLPFGWGRRFGRGMPRWANLMAGGWDIGLLDIAQTGLPFSINSPVDTFGGGNGTRVNYSGGRIGEVLVAGGGPRYFTPEQAAAFQIPAPGEMGNIGKNVFHRPLMWNIDLSAVKRIPITEARSVVLRIEAYNAWNAAVFGNLRTDLLTPQTFGRFISTANPARNLQIAVRYEF